MGKNSRVYSDSDHADICNFLQEYENSEAKPSLPKHQRWIRTFCLIDYNETKKLAKKDSQREVVKKSDLFDRIHDLHLAFGHAGRDKLVPELAKKYYKLQCRLQPCSYVSSRL